MYHILAVEGIDRIGKSTFIDAITECINKKLSAMGDNIPVVVEKPTIGINTLHNIGYPLADTPGIMEIRNIGLMEEFLYRCQIAQQTNQSKIIIRDRFNLSELAYGECYRSQHITRVVGEQSVISGITKYREWNSWFEKELSKSANVYLITFVLDKESYPNEDEAISAHDLVKVNNKFRDIHAISKFPKTLIELNKNAETGMTDILEYVEPIANEFIRLCSE